jgi:hypothetical protein
MTAVSHAGMSMPAPPAARASASPLRQEQAGSRPIRDIGSVMRAVKVTAMIVAPLTAALAVLGGIGSFTTVRDLAVPWFGRSAWIVPTGIDIGILALLAWDLLTEYLGLPWPLLRWIAWAFIAGTVYLNIAAAHGNPVGSVMHAAMPALFVTFTEGVRHLIRHLAGLANGTRIEGIPLPRWLLAPRSSFTLRRHMVLWHVTSYQEGLRLEYGRLLAISRLQEGYGRWLWRWKAPLHERLALRLAPAGSSFSNDVPAPIVPAGFTEPATVAALTEPEPVPVTEPKVPPAGPTQVIPPLALLGFLPRQHTVDIQPPAPIPARLSEQDRKLLQAASAVLRDAERAGVRLGQGALARHLRSQGFSIANERLRWLIEAAGTWPSGGRPSTARED